MWPFLIALVALLGFSIAARDARVWGTALVLLLNWGACTAYVSATGDAYPWFAFAAIDYVSGFTVLAMLRGPRSLWQVAVGLIYAAMLVSHGARGALETPEAIYYGWYFLHYAAWAQVALVAGWGSYELASRRGLFARRASSRDVVMGRRGTSIAPR